MVNKKVALTGNEAVALSMKQVNPDVVAAYPITPQTEIVQFFSSFVANGQVDSEFVTVESEHSAMSATVGASAAGARAMTATSANGLALMWEIIYIAASSRLPIVMPVVNRALSGPINIHCDHSDSMGARDSGWIQLYSENSQEAYDNMFQAVKIAENPDVLLPVMVMMDGFIISHGLENLEIIDDESVRDFVGEYKPEEHLLDTKNPITVGPLALFDYFFEIKRQQAESMKNAKDVILNVGKKYEKLTGREYGLFESYKLDDAETAILVMSSAAGTGKYVVDKLREEGKKVGLMKMRVFRPFPHREIADALKHIKVLAVMDRADTFSDFGGPLFAPVRGALFDVRDTADNIKIVNYIYGLGGRDVVPSDFEKVFNKLDEIKKTGKYNNIVNYLGVRE